MKVLNIETFLKNALNCCSCSGYSHMLLPLVQLYLVDPQNGTMEGQLHILKNVIKKAVDNQTVPPPSRGIIVAKNGTIAGQTWHLFEKCMLLQAVVTVTHTPSTDIWWPIEWYYGRPTSHSKECNWEGSGQSDIPPPSKRHLATKSSTTSDQLYICLLISCLAVGEVNHTLEYE